MTKWGLFAVKNFFNWLQCLDPFGIKNINCRYDVSLWIFQPTLICVCAYIYMYNENFNNIVVLGSHRSRKTSTADMRLANDFLLFCKGSWVWHTTASGVVRLLFWSSEECEILYVNVNHLVCRVSWGCRIHRLHLCWGVKKKHPMRLLNMTLNNVAWNSSTW